MERTNILGVNIHILESYKTTDNYLKMNDKCYITINNFHTVIEAVRNEIFKKILKSSAIAIADGQPLVIYSKLKGIKNIQRIFGLTLFEKTLERGQEKELKHFLVVLNRF